MSSSSAPLPPSRSSSTSSVGEGSLIFGSSKLSEEDGKILSLSQSVLSISSNTPPHQASSSSILPSSPSLERSQEILKQLQQEIEKGKSAQKQAEEELSARNRYHRFLQVANNPCRDAFFNIDCESIFSFNEPIPQEEKRKYLFLLSLNNWYYFGEDYKEHNWPLAFFASILPQIFSSVTNFDVFLYKVFEIQESNFTYDVKDRETRKITKSTENNRALNATARILVNMKENCANDTKRLEYLERKNVQGHLQYFFYEFAKHLVGRKVRSDEKILALAQFFSVEVNLIKRKRIRNRDTGQWELYSKSQDADNFTDTAINESILEQGVKPILLKKPDGQYVVLMTSGTLTNPVATPPVQEPERSVIWSMFSSIGDFFMAIGSGIYAFFYAITDPFRWLWRL